ncbi:hypothetical protein RB595_010406 [Gaeumannomyces hyphopodioides]
MGSSTSTTEPSSAQGPPSVHRLSFDELPDPRRVWPASPGSREEGLGRLVLLTPETVAAAAASCIKKGHRASLNWDLTKLDFANFNRAPAQHHVISLLDGAAFDDVCVFNPRRSSQWDGLRHFSAPFPTAQGAARRLFYGGVTSADIADRKNTRIGLQHWAREGICGRGVLLGYVEYARRNGIQYKSLSDHAIPLRVLLEIAHQQDVVFRRGDMLFVRVGLVKEWDTEMGVADKLAYCQSSNPQHAGVEGTKEMLRWIWVPVLLPWPVTPCHLRCTRPRNPTRGRAGRTWRGCLCASTCWRPGACLSGSFLISRSLVGDVPRRRDGTFFATSASLNVSGGVSSLANCLAIL